MSRFFPKYEVLRNWEYLCVICGRPFAHLACVTMEHIVPRSRGGKGRSNFAPSHYRCNNKRGDRSLLRAVDSIEREFQHIVQRAGEHKAIKWLNKPNPGSPYSLDPIVIYKGMALLTFKVKAA